MNAAAVTPSELLRTAADAIDNWPEQALAHDTQPQHPEDAYSVAVTVLDTVTGLRLAEWQRNRTATAT